MLVEINCKPNDFLHFCIYVHVIIWIYKKFKIHALPVNYTSSSVQSYGDIKENAYMYFTGERHSRIVSVN